MTVRYLASARDQEFLTEIQRLCDQVNKQQFQIEKQLSAIKTALIYADFRDCLEVKDLLSEALENK